MPYSGHTMPTDHSPKPAMLIRDVIRDDAAYISENLRTSDRTELRLLGRMPSDAVLGFDISDVVRTIERDGRPVVIFGRSPMSTGPTDRIVWLLATSEIDTIARSFVLACKPELERLRAGCERLINLTHSRNLTVLRWLRWLGFAVDTTPIGPGGEFFMFWLQGAAADSKGN